MEDFDEKRGKYLHRLRANRAFTLQAVANYVGVSASAVSQWESGSKHPDKAHLYRLVSLFNPEPEEWYSIFRDEIEIELGGYIDLPESGIQTAAATAIPTAKLLRLAGKIDEAETTISFWTQVVVIRIKSKMSINFRLRLEKRTLKDVKHLPDMLDDIIVRSLFSIRG